MTNPRLREVTPCRVCGERATLFLSLLGAEKVKAACDACAPLFLETMAKVVRESNALRGIPTAVAE